MNTERIRLRIHRIKLLMAAVEEHLSEAEWSPCRMCRESGEERALARVRRLNERVSSLEIEVYLLACR